MQFSNGLARADSIKRDGQWNPIIVKQISQGYDLIAGECRLRAVKSLESEKIMRARNYQLRLVRGFQGGL